MTKQSPKISRHHTISVMILIFIALFLSVTVSGQEVSPYEHGDTLTRLHGKVTDFTTHNGLFQVHIINLSRNRATLSDRFGYFTLEAMLHDTIYLSHVGFKKRLFKVTSHDLDSGAISTIYMYEDTIMLKKFRLLSATREVQFKSDFITRPFIPDTLNPAFEAFIKENHFSAPSGGIVLPGPFTILYENFNRGARLQRRIERNREEYYENLPEEEKRRVLFFDE
jgi:hypothetical protein